MIRTKIVELSTLNAIAYRYKFKAGESGVTIIRYDSVQPGLAIIDRRTGEPVLAENTPVELFPVEAFQEAIELTSGMPYSRKGNVKLSSDNQDTEEDTEMPEELATVSSEEYNAVVKAYTNKKGELSYDLLNKDLIQFAQSSKIVTEMVGNKASVEEIVAHVVKVKIEALTGNRKITNAQINRIVEMLDEVSPRYVFKELNEEIRKMLSN